MLSELEDRINDEYSTAYNELSKKCDKYFLNFAKKDSVKLSQVSAGEITQEEYKEWRKNQMLIGQRWSDMVDTMAKDLTKVDQKVISMTRGFLPEAYALNHNYGTYEGEKSTHVDTAYTLYDRHTVERLLRDQPNLLPALKPNSPTARKLAERKDLIWNKQHINSAITQGVLQGDDLKSVSKRLQAVTDMDNKAAKRNARTMMTGAQNSGRLDSYKRMQDMGIEVQKQWMATLDHYTRSSHAHLDGERADVDKKFANGLRYPGDREGRPEEVYNCRCTMIAYFPEYEYENMQRYDNVDGKPIDQVTYAEWAGWKEKIAKKRIYTKEELLGKAYNGKYSQEDIDTIVGMYNEAPEEVKEFYAKYSNELLPNLEDNEGVNPRTKTDFGYYSPNEDRVHFMHKRDKEGRSDQLSFELGVHEYGHNMDYIAGKAKGATTISNSYKDKDGRTFGEIINKDWRKAVRDFAGYSSDSKTGNLLDIYDWEIDLQMNSEYGSGGYWTASRALRAWRRENGISRDDPMYEKLRDELWNIRDFLGDEDHDTKDVRLYMEYMKKHKDIFFDILITDDTKSGYDFYRRNAEEPPVTADDIKGFCKMIRSTYSQSERGCLSDMFENFSVTNGGPDYPFGIGHGKAYATAYGIYSKTDPMYYERLEKEAFAEFTEMAVVNKEALEVAKKYLPNAYNAYIEMIKEAVK